MALSRGKNYSVLVIPDDGSRTREFKVSTFLLRALLVLALIDLALVLAGAFSVWRLKGWGEAVEQLKAENVRLQEEAGKVQKLSQALERMKATDEQIRTMLSGDASFNGSPPETASGDSSGASSSGKR